MDWICILPPLLAIILALITKRVGVSLGTGIISGCLIASNFSIINSAAVAWNQSSSLFYSDNQIQFDNISLILFSTFIGMMVAILSESGSMLAIVSALSKFAKTRQKTQFTVWLMGVIIFFDDYANTLIVGNTVRPLTDHHRISREKLAYIVDSTAAPVAALAFVTTWIGFELTQIDAGIKNLAISASSTTLFFNSLSYSFYPLLTLGFILTLIISGRDFGPMKTAENKALLTTKPSTVVNEANSPLYKSVLPIAVMLIATIVTLFATGYDSMSSFSIAQTLGNANSYLALLVGSSIGLLFAIALTLLSHSFKAVIRFAWIGAKQIGEPLLILVLAWVLGNVIGELKTAHYLVGLAGNVLQVSYLPALIFCLAAAISFATGSSFGTMSILYPIALPLSWAVIQQAGIPSNEGLEILAHVISVVLAGSVFGDHCSPISDTTILSSMATGCKHIAHVRTQLPYALTVGVVSIAMSLSVGFGWVGPVLAFLFGFTILLVIIRLLGKPLQPAL